MQPNYHVRIPLPQPPRDVPMVEVRSVPLTLPVEPLEAAGPKLAPIPVATPTPTPTPATQPADGSEAYYKSWIYNEESGNNPTRWNTSGCLGLGQACPASKLLAVCPSMDYGCEDAWFTNYMQTRYSTWQAAYVFHIAHNWW